MNTLRITLFGPLTATINHRPVAFRTDAERALLAYLAVQQGVPQRRDTLAALLSPDRSDADALTYLRNRLTRLREALQDAQAIPPWLMVDRKQIALRTGADLIIDLPQFEDQLTSVARHAHRQLAGCPTCLDHLAAAVNLGRGELLAGLHFSSELWEAWLVTQREYLHQRVLDAMTQLRDAQTVRGEWTAVLALTQRQLALEPWLEAAHRAAMTAHVQLGDRAAALAHYDQCAALLWNELGVEPEETTQQLHQQILQDHLAVTVRGTGANNLPGQTGRFFGRAAEKTYLLQQLVEPNVRLITLVGPGGSGKTRLAIEVGQAIQTSFPDGVWVIPLYAVQGGAEQIKIAIGEAAGLGQRDKQLTGDQVLAILRDKQLLLILDNGEVALEQLDFLPSWLHRAPKLVILATSRTPLNLGAEAVLLLDGLPTGIGEADSAIEAAEALFAERGQMARADFLLTAENLPQVRQICRLVDGLPLGIALAAAWVRRRSLAQISEAIGQSLDFLSTGLRDVDPRHRSMRAVFETAWQLLSATEQAVLAALAVFPTDFSAAAATAVTGGGTGATLMDLDLLCEKSLLQQQPEAERYSLHSLLRQFAAEKLADRRHAVERAFVAYFYGFARAHRDEYAALQPEWANFAAAIVSAHGQGAWRTVLDFVAVLDEPWFRQIRFTDLRAGLTMAREAATALADQSALGRVQLRLGEITVELNEYAAAEAALSAALAWFEQQEEGWGIAQANYWLGRLKSEQGEDDQAFPHFQTSRQIFADENDLVGVAKNLTLMAVHQWKTQRDFPAAQRYLEQAMALQQQQPLSSSYVETLRYLARVQLMTAAYAEAEETLEEAAQCSQQLQNLGEFAAVLYERVLLHKSRRQFDAALHDGHRCLEILQRLGSLRAAALIKTQLGLLRQAKNELAQALTLLQDGLVIFTELGDTYEQAYSYYYLAKLYAEQGDAAASQQAKTQAQRLNLVLNNPQLSERLAGTA
ncbi:MAG: hypothetical protein KF832_22910 [Caldilineaceae bacterium]|nr:hypothetical protein [Caldilineaceae bacterium]